VERVSFVVVGGVDDKVARARLAVHRHTAIEAVIVFVVAPSAITPAGAALKGAVDVFKRPAGIFTHQNGVAGSIQNMGHLVGF
jgi:hypothetical protein